MELFKSVALEVKRVIKSFLHSFPNKAGKLPNDDTSRVFSGKLEENLYSLFKLPDNQELSHISLAKVIITILLDTDREVRLDRIFTYESFWYQYYFMLVQFSFIMAGLLYFIFTAINFCRKLISKDSQKKKEEKTRERAEEMLELSKGLSKQINNLESRLGEAVSTMDQYNLQNYQTVFSKYCNKNERDRKVLEKYKPSAPRALLDPQETDRLM